MSFRRAGQLRYFRRQLDRGVSQTAKVSEVLVGMLLRVGGPVLGHEDVPHELPAGRLGLEGLAVGLGERPEHLAPLGVLPEAVGIVEGVTGLVAEEHHHRLVVLDFARLFLFDAGQAAVGQVERDPDHRHLVGAAPGVGQVEPGAEPQLLGRQLAPQFLDQGLKRRAHDPQIQVADPRIEKLVTDGCPTVYGRL